MPADANIFQTYLQAPKSVIDYQAEYDKADAQKNALQLAAINVQKGQMDLSNSTELNRQKNALRDAVAGGQLDLSNPDHVARAVSIAPDVAPAMLKTLQESATSRATATKDTALAGKATADTGKITAETQAAAVSHMGDAIAALQQLPGVSPAHVVASIQNAGKLYGIPDALVQQAVSQVPQDPAQLPAFLQAKNAQLMSAKERMGYIAPDANSQLQAQTSRANNAATNATSRANNSATISGENMRAGVSADGAVSPDVEAQAQAIAKGQLLPPSGAALINPKNARVLARVMEINPNYDATTVLAKKKAATDFTTGSQGNSMRSFAVAGQHLDQLGTLVDAMDNGNMQLVNKIGNAYSQQTGNPAVTNFDAAKDVVSKEVVKAIVAGGGGVAEREELSKLMDNAKSPAQLKGVIKQYRNLMAAQHDALLQQRRAAGLPDSTLPNYQDANGSAGTVPSDIAAILQKHGGR